MFPTIHKPLQRCINQYYRQDLTKGQSNMHNRRNRNKLKPGCALDDKRNETKIIF